MSEQIWSIQEDALVWKIKPGQIHRDNIEMSGLYCDAIVEYGVNINAICDSIVHNVKYKLEHNTGLKVTKVNVLVELGLYLVKLILLN